MRDIRSMLKSGSIALIMEAFEVVTDHFPTHLDSNARYAGTTSFLFLNNRMLLSWYDREQRFKLMEFVGFGKLPPTAFIQLLADRSVVAKWLPLRLHRFTLSLKWLQP